MHFFSFDLAVFTGHPADLASDLHSLPAVEGAGHILQRRTRRDSGDAAVAGAVARADIINIIAMTMKNVCFFSLFFCSLILLHILPVVVMKYLCFFSDKHGSGLGVIHY